MSQEIVTMCCPIADCGTEIALTQPDKGLRAFPKTGPVRTGLVHTCGKKLTYWGKQVEVDGRFSNEIVWKIKLKVEYPTIINGLVHLSCPFCGQKLQLQVVSSKTTYICNRCSVGDNNVNSFTYWLRWEWSKKSSPDGVKRLCLYMFVEDPDGKYGLWRQIQNANKQNP
jgi:hypothetical protein